jgi:glycosyltransferase involved in cell wall biosynthesis
VAAIDKTAVDTRPRSSLRQDRGKRSGDNQILTQLELPIDPTQARIIAIIPAYNEERFIGSVVLQALRYTSRVIVVDDGSTDNTSQIANSAGATVFRHECNQGKGAALNTGFREARKFDPQVVICLDGDGQHTPAEIDILIAPVITNQADIVVGSRYIGSTNQVPRHRVWGHRLFNLLTGYASGVKSSDSQSGFRALSPSALDAFYFRSKDFSVESEMQFLAREHDLRVKEEPVTIRYPDPPKRSVLMHGMRVLNGLLRLVGQHRPLLSFGVPGSIIIGLGILLGLRVFEIFGRTSQLAVGSALLSILLSMTGIITLMTGFILHSVRGLLSDILKQK